MSLNNVAVLSLVMATFQGQPENRNFLSPAGFQFILEKDRNVDFFCTKANVPDLTLGVANQPSYNKMIDVPGDIIEFGDLTIEFLVDEDLKNYLAIHDWIRGLGFPNSPQDFKNLITDDNKQKDLKYQFSDATLLILNSSNNINFQVQFRDAYPYSLTGLDFDAGIDGEEFFTSTVSFKYTIYNILDKNGRPL